MTLLATLQKSSPSEIRLETCALWGSEALSLRVWFKNTDGKYVPGEWCVAFTPELLGDVLRMFSKVARRSEERGDTQ